MCKTLQMMFYKLFALFFVCFGQLDAYYLESAHAQMQGRRYEMEDAHKILPLGNFMPKKAFFGLYDGHGGVRVANIAAGVESVEPVLSLHDEVARHLLLSKIITKEAFIDAFCAFDRNVLALPYEDSGTTAVVAVVDTTNNDRHKLWLAWTGDSRAVLVDVQGNVAYETKDHDITDPKEAARLKEAKAVITRGAVSRICGLAMPRSLGDRSVKMYAKRFAGGNDVVIPHPDVQSIELTEQHECLILACDGVWDLVTSKEAATFVHDRLQESASLQDTAQALRDLAYEKGSTDNISVVLISVANRLQHT